MTMHKVVVDKTALHSYLEKGYTPSSGSLAEHMGKAWEMLCEEDRADLVLLEIEEAKHTAMNAPARVFCVQRSGQYMLDRVELLKLDVLERGSLNTLCASAEIDDGPRWFLDDDLGEDARQAVAKARPHIVAAIADHRRIADELESFLMGTEAL